MRKFLGAGPAGRRVLWGAAAVAGLGLVAFQSPLLDNPVQVIANKLNDYYSLTQPEKVYLSLDRPAYGTGETVWFSAFVVDALRHQPDTLDRVLHVDLLSPTRQVVVRRTLRVVGGRATGDLDLADTLQAGTYLLRAYTSWMLNGNPSFVYQRRLQVWPAAPDPNAADGTASAPLTKAAARPAAPRPDVQFFPEGGTFVAGLPTVLGFKAVAPGGRSVDVSGQVLDAQGKAVVPSFSSLHGGMGRVSFTPAAGQTYRARVKLPDGSAADYPLPAAQPAGYALHVEDAGDTFVVEARYQGAAGAPAPGPVALVSEVRGFLVGLAPRPIVAGTPTTWRVPKKSYPNGIAHFTLFDAASIAQAERLAFVQNGPAGLKVTLTPDRAAYAPHQQVRLKVQVADASGQPVATRLAVSVAEAGAAALDPEGGNVISNLLLTSDLAGYVDSPGYYFQNQSPATAQALDNLLLTQGWRRFVWREVLGATPPALPYAHERSLSLSGTVTGMGSQGLGGSQLTFIQTKPERNILSATTGPNGRFNFTGFSGQDTAVVTLQARRAGGASNVTVRPDVGPSVVGPPLPLLPSVEAAPPGIADYVRRSRQQQSLEHDRQPDYSVSRNIRLNNVAVTAKRPIIAPDDSRRLYPGVVANTIIDIANMPAAQSGIPLFSVLQGRVAGLAVSGNPPNQSISIRNTPVSLFVLDGIRVDQDAINTIPTTDIEAVEVFKGPEAAVFGAGSGGGVIAVYTKRANKNYRGPANVATPGLITVKLAGYYQAREFYMPRYGAPVMNAPSGTDPRRLTIYWNPEAATDASGQADFYFFTADASGNFQATVEGIGLNGTPARGTVQLYVAPK